MKKSVLALRGTGRIALDEVRKHPDLRRSKVAEAAGLSEPMIVWARRIMRLARPELIIAVEEGRVALYIAARVSRWPVDAQLEFLRLDTTTGEGSTLTARCLVAPFQSQEHEHDE